MVDEINSVDCGSSLVFCFPSICGKPTTKLPQEWAKAAKDYHLSLDEMSHLIDGNLNKLFLFYVRTIQQPSAEGFYVWAARFLENLT